MESRKRKNVGKQMSKNVIHEYVVEMKRSTNFSIFGIRYKMLLSEAISVVIAKLMKGLKANEDEPTVT
ncbi:hypothetical protein V6N13_103759 [Hibiscus sabdariffa]